jgi:hypothetical protein
MSEEKWLEKFDETYETFKWFWIEYGFDWNYLMILRGKKKVTSMISLMNDTWFKLPDSKFNIIENPKGWSEFLFLLEAL